MKQQRGRSDVSRLCEAIERLVELHRTMAVAQLDHDRKILDRALSVADWGLSQRRIEAETAYHVDRPINPYVVPEPPARRIPDVPDIQVSNGSTSFSD